MTKANKTAKSGKKSMTKKISPGSTKPETCSLGVKGLTPAPDVKPKNSLLQPFGVGSGANQGVTLCKPPVADYIQAHASLDQGKELAEQRQVVMMSDGTSIEFRITPEQRLKDAGNVGQQPNAVSTLKSSSQKF